VGWRTLSNDNSDKERWKRLGFRNVVRLGYVSLFTDISTEMILGVLPVNFIINQLGATAAILGLIEGSAEAANNIFRIFAGVLTDKIGRRKPIVMIGYGLSTLAKPLFAVANSWGQAFAVRIVDRAGKGTRTTPRDALISDSIPKSQAGKGFGLHSSLDQIGAVLGPLLAFALLPFIGLRNLFLISFIPGAISLIILVFFVSDARGRTRRRTVFENAKAVLTRDFVLLLVVLEIFALGAYNFSFILLEAQSLGVQGNFIPLVYALLNLATVIIAFPAGIIADRIGKLPVLLLSFLVFMGTSLAGVVLVGYWAYGLLIAIFYGGYLSISDTVQRAMVPDFTRPELKGTAYAFYYTIIAIGSLIANSVFGALWTSLGSVVAFEFSIATSAVAAVALVIFALRGRIIGNMGR
jgi:MFS family permease